MKEKIINFFKDTSLYIHLAAMLILSLLLYFAVHIYLDVYTDHGEKIPVPDLRGLSFERAAEIVDEYDMTLEVYDTTYVASYTKGSVVDHIPRPGFNVKEGRKIYVTINSDTPPQVDMPDLIDESLRQAISIIENTGLTMGKIIYKPGFKDLVLGQEAYGETVLPGTKINKGTTINLLVGKGDASEKTYIPKLLGLTLEEARVKVANAGLNIDFIKFDEQIQRPEDSLDAVIWRQTPEYKAETQISAGSNIDVWLLPKEQYVEDEADM